jgi:hypothetical protein
MAVRGCASASYGPFHGRLNAIGGKRGRQEFLYLWVWALLQWREGMEYTFDGRVWSIYLTVLQCIEYTIDGRVWRIYFTVLQCIEYIHLTAGYGVYI